MSLADTCMALFAILLALFVGRFVSTLWRWVIFLWLVSTAVLASQGLVTAERVPLLMVPSVLLTLAMVLSPAGGRVARSVRMPWLIALQGFRLPVELILLAYYFESRIPQAMTFEGRNFDVLTAVSALVLAPAVAGGKAGTKAILLWNLCGFALLINVVSIAVLAVPGPMRTLTDDLANTLPMAWPSIWILFCVLVAFASHLLIFRKLMQGGA